MIKRKDFFVIAILVYFLFPGESFSQGEINNQNKIFYRNESTFAVLLSTNGLGINYSYAKRMDAYKKVTYQFDITEIKHPKEVKVSTVFQQGSSIIYGKLNSVYSLRGGIGVQSEIFRKLDKGSISIRRMFSGGLNIAFIKPVYYWMQVKDPQNIQETIIQAQKFDTSPNALNVIVREASFFKGMSELNINPGLYLKYSYTFEYGKYDAIFNALEGGVILDVFPRKMKIMATGSNSKFYEALYEHIFISLFLSYRFGWVKDAQFKNKKNKLEKILTN